MRRAPPFEDSSPVAARSTVAPFEPVASSALLLQPAGRDAAGLPENEDALGLMDRLTAGA